MTIKAINGLNDISFTASETLDSETSITIECESDYSSSCTLQLQSPFYCTDSTSICDYITANPTHYPSQPPTSNPSTISPTTATPKIS